jgi:hypoxanthine phosphoribosyltransferase
MSGPPPAVAAVRNAIRKAVADLPDGARVLVAGSGGADSTALAAATAFVASGARPDLPDRPPRLRAGFACVDHAWSSSSADHARRAAQAAEDLGLHPAVVRSAPAARSEGAARDARREALLAEAASQEADAILLAHTLDDQAETVLLRLGRGSGARSLSAMAPRTGIWRRPLLGLRRDVVRASCAALGLAVWDDPANADPVFARSRVRHEVLPLLERCLGPGIAESLARSADLLRADADALDALAAEEAAANRELQVAGLQKLPAAVRSRVLRSAALEAGSAATALTAGHIAMLDALVTRWRGQGPLQLPGGVTAARRDGRIELMHGAPTDGRFGVEVRQTRR